MTRHPNHKDEFRAGQEPLVPGGHEGGEDALRAEDGTSAPSGIPPKGCATPRAPKAPGDLISDRGEIATR